MPIKIPNSLPATEILENENSEETLFDTCGFGRFVCYSNV